MFSGRSDGLAQREVPVGMSAFDDLVALIADILDAQGDDRDPTFVAAQVHTWVHGIVTLLSCHPDGPWPATDDLLDEVIARLGLA